MAEPAYKIINNDLEAEVEIMDIDNHAVDLFIESIINRRLRDGVNIDSIFTILNSFIDYKGPEFRDELYRRNVEGKNVIMPYITKNTDVVPYKVVHDVLDMFDIGEVKDFIKKSGLVYAPNTLPDTYDINIELDERGSRDQTYIKEDYYDLIALVTILKSTIGLIGEYASIRDTVLSKTTYKEYILLNFYRSHKIFKTEPFVKLYNSIGKLVDRLFKDSEKSAIRIIDQGVSKENMPLHIVALVVIQKLLINDEISDDDVKHTVTKIYSYASDKLKLKDNNNSKYRIKYFSEEESDGSESESVLESYRKNSDLTPGHIEEFKVNTENIFYLARLLDIQADDKTIIEFRTSIEELNDKLPIYECSLISSWVFKGIIDMRALEHLNLEHVLNIITVAILWCLENDHKQIAMILGCYAITSTGNKVNFSLRNKIDPELKEKLKELFPYEKVAVINGILSSINFIEDTINNISKSLMSYNMMSVLPVRVLNEINGSELRNILVPENIRNLMASYVISIEEKHIARLAKRKEFLKEFDL